MSDDYICNDKNIIEDVKKIRDMTDEEFDEFIKKIKKSDSHSQ